MSQSAAPGRAPLALWGALLACAAGAVLSAQKDAPGPPALVQAARSGDLEQLRGLVREAGVDAAAAVNAEGDTLLHRIAFLVPPERQRDWIAEMIALGADMNARNTRGRTPLHLAARAGRIEAVRALIARGADVNPVDLEHATPLLDAAEAGRLETAASLLAAGADPNRKPDPRDLTHTPLTISSYRGRIEMAELLLAAGADVNLPAARRTALDWARRAKHFRMVELLTSRNAVD